MTDNRPFDLQEIFLQDCRYRDLSSATIKDYNWFLTDIKANLGNWDQIVKQSIKDFVLRKMNSGNSPASVNHYIRVIKAFYSFLQREGHVDINPMAGLSLVSMPDKLKPVLEPKQISNMIASIPESHFLTMRDKAMILLLFDTAIRLKELLTIKLNDIDMKFGTIKITGKGRKDRVVPIGQKAKRELVKYLKLRGENHSEYLFCTRTSQQIIPRNFQRSLTNYGKKVGIKVSPHLIRHSAATFLAKNEMPAQHIQLLLGHTNLAVTQNYINRLVAQEGLQISHRRLSPGDRI